VNLPSLGAGLVNQDADVASRQHHDDNVLWSGPVLLWSAPALPTNPVAAQRPQETLPLKKKSFPVRLLFIITIKLLSKQLLIGPADFFFVRKKKRKRKTDSSGPKKPAT